MKFKKFFSFQILLMISIFTLMLTACEDKKTETGDKTAIVEDESAKIDTSYEDTKEEETKELTIEEKIKSWTADNKCTDYLEEPCFDQVIVNDIYEHSNHYAIGTLFYDEDEDAIWEQDDINSWHYYSEVDGSQRVEPDVSENYEPTPPNEAQKVYAEWADAYYSGDTERERQLRGQLSLIQIDEFEEQGKPVAYGPDGPIYDYDHYRQSIREQYGI